MIYLKFTRFADIAILITNLAGGGAERAAVNLAKGFVKQGLKVNFILLRKEGIFLNYLPNEVNTISLDTSKDLLYRFWLQRVIYFLFQRQLKSIHLDLLLKLNILQKKLGFYQNISTMQIQWNIWALRLADYLKENPCRAFLAILPYPNIVALKARQMVHIPFKLAICEQTTPSFTLQKMSQGNLIKQWMKKLYPKADIIIAISYGVAKDLINNFNLPSDKIKVIYNPVVTPEIQKMAIKEVEHPWFKPDQPPVILGAGRLVPAKDFPTLLHAFYLVRQVRRVRLVILGEGKERPRLEQLVHQLGIQDDVLMPGFVDNPFAYMAKASVFVLSSAWEGLSNVLIEALACGCPVVSTDCQSGPREILDNGRYGRLVPVGNFEAMARAILETLDDPNKPADKEARIQRAMEFSVDKAVNQYLEVLGLS